MNRLTIALFGALLCWISLGSAQDAGSQTPTATLTLESGKVSGVKIDANLNAFLGVPFAAPPVGDLRWKPPMPVQPWDGIRSCSKFASMAIQSSRPQVGNEDCLYLNIWTTAKDETKHPVMVWIHGGGFANGFSNTATFNGTRLAESGVVFVSINYRLGTMGFFAHPALSAESEEKVSGNYGILDQIAALKWIQKNIAAFGGDPANVTIFGESAGATAAYVLVASPLAKGLFHQAILQSLWIDHYNIRHLTKDTFAGRSAESENSERVKELFGDQGDVLTMLRSMPAIDATVKLGRTQAVLVDGHLLPDFPYQIFADGKQNQVTTIAGTNRDEGTAFATWKPLKSIDEYQQTLRDQFGDQSQLVLDLYGVQRWQDARIALITKTTDCWFVQPTREYLRSMASNGNACWQYQFTHRSLSRPYLGATHGAEIQFVFNTIDDSRLVGANKAVASSMIQYWTQFARSGNPNANGLPEWPQYTEPEDQYLEIGREIVVRSGLRSEACDVYDKVFAALRTAGPQELKALQQNSAVEDAQP